MLHTGTFVTRTTDGGRQQQSFVPRLVVVGISKIDVVVDGVAINAVTLTV